MHRIIEVAQQLGVSKVTIYKKISALKPDIKQYIVKEKNVTFLTDPGVEMIKESLKNSPFILSKDERIACGDQGLLETADQVKLKEQFVEEVQAKELALKNHFNDLVMTYDYLKVVKKSKLDRLKTLQEAVESIRNSSSLLRKQIEILINLEESDSK